MVILDEVRLRQILFNLVGNAEKFTETGYVKVVVERLFTDEFDSELELVITVEDSGIGIPSQNINEILESFKQHEALDTQKYDGTGLGLTICKRLLKVMGGEITVKSAPGKGSVFRVIIKNVPVAAYNTIDTVTKDTFELENTTFEEATILVVDDIASNREVMREMLPKMGLKVIVSENGKIALELLEKIRPDLIFMDIKMPVMDGIEATRKIKANPDTQSIPVVALTTSSSQDTKSDVLARGFDAFVRKPFSVGELISVLLNFIKCLKYETPEKSDNPLETVDFEKVKEPVELMELLNGEFLSSCEFLKDVMVFGEIKNFGERIRLLAEKHGAQFLSRYGSNISSYADSFDTVGIADQLAEFAGVIERLNKRWKEYIKK
ncbi:MAG: response regulator [bacterium]|nr:response regulator [bacterium]